MIRRELFHNMAQFGQRPEKQVPWVEITALQSCQGGGQVWGGLKEDLLRLRPADVISSEIS